jgi:hypothetical protein
MKWLNVAAFIGLSICNTLAICRRERREGAGFEVLSEGLDDGVCGIIPSDFERAKDGHQDRLCPRPFVTAIALNHFAHNHSRTNLPLRMIVGRGNRGIIQKHQQFIPVFL